MEKKQQTLANKEAKNTSTRPWPDLPHQMATQSTLEQGINFGSVTKSWRAAPKKCNPNAVPWLQISDTNNTKGDQQQRNLTDRWPPCRAPRYLWKYYLGCTNGILVANGPTTSTDILWDPVERSWYSLPLWDARVEFKCAAISSKLSLGCMVMVLTGTSHPAFMFHRLIGARRGTTHPSCMFKYIISKKGGEYEWIKQDCSLINPHAPDKSQKHYMQFTNAIGFRGKFYTLTLQGTLAVIEQVDSHLKITSLGTKRAIPSISLKHFREYLVESDGEILLIFLSKKSINVGNDVKNFQLDIVRLSWTKMECLGDQTLFVGEQCCVSVSTSKVGCKKNCLYFHFSHNTIHGWWLYDMKSGSISPGWSDNNSKTKSSVWDEPEWMSDFVKRK